MSDDKTKNNSKPNNTISPVDNLQFFGSREGLSIIPMPAQRTGWSPLGSLGRYDKGRTSAIYDNQPINPKVAEQYYRASNQTIAGKWVNAFGRFVPSVGAKVGQGLGHVGGVFAAGLSGNFEDVYDNAVVNAMAHVQELVDKTLPIHVGKNYSEGNLVKKMLTADFWTTDMADGLEFLASAYIPGATLGKIGGLTAAAGKGTKLAQALTAVTEATGLNTGTLATTIYNTISEAGFEAKDTRDNYREVRAQALGFNNYDSLPYALKQQVNFESADAAKTVMGTNLVGLLAPNFIQSKWFNPKGNLSTSAIRKQIVKGELTKGEVATKYKAWQSAVKGFASEGLWEENFQTAIQQYEQRVAQGHITDANFVTGMLENMGTNIWGFVRAVPDILSFGALKTSADAQTLQDEGATAILLGGLLGGPFAAYSEFKENQALKAYVANMSSHWANVLKYKTAADAILIDDVKAIYKEFGTVDALDDEGKPTGKKIVNLINPETGTKQISQENLWNVMVNSLRNLSFIQEGTFADAAADPHWANFNSSMGMAGWIWNLSSKGLQLEDIEDVLNYAIKDIENVPEGLDIAANLEESKADLLTLAKLYKETEAEVSSIDDFNDTHVDNRFNRILHRLSFYTKAKDLALNKLSLQAAQNPEALEQINKLKEDNAQVASDIKKNRNKLKADFEQAILPIEKLTDDTQRLAKELKNTTDETEKEKIQRQIDVNEFIFKEHVGIEGFQEIEQAKLREGGSVVDQFASPFYTGLPSRITAGKSSDPTVEQPLLPIRRKTYYDRGKSAILLNKLNQVLTPSITNFADTSGELPTPRQDLIDFELLNEVLSDLLLEPNLITKEIKQLLAADSPINRAIGKKQLELQQELSTQESIAHDLGLSILIGEGTEDTQKLREEADLRVEQIKVELNTLEVIQQKISAVTSAQVVKKSTFKGTPEESLKGTYLMDEFLKDFSLIEDNISDATYIENFTNKTLLNSLSQSLQQAIAAYEDRQDISEDFRAQVLDLLRGKYSEYVDTLYKAYHKNIAHRQTKQTIVSRFLHSIVDPVFTASSPALNWVYTNFISKVLGEDKLKAATDLFQKGLYPAYEIALGLWAEQMPEELKEDFIMSYGSFRAAKLEELKTKYPKWASAKSTSIQELLEGFTVNPQKYLASVIGFTVSRLYITPTLNPSLYELVQTKDVIKFITDQEANDYKSLQGVIDVGDQQIPMAVVVKDLIETYKELLAIKLLEEALDSKVDTKKMLLAQEMSYKAFNTGKTPEQTLAPTFEQQVAITQALNFLFTPHTSKEGDNIFFLEGSPGSGKTQVVVKYIIDLYKRIKGVEQPKLYALGHTSRASKAITKTVFGEERSTSVEEFLAQDLNEIDILVIDEAPAFKSADMDHIKYAVEQHNKKGKHKIKILAFGDPAQITSSDFFEINSTTEKYTHVANPLTVVYRTNVASITDFFMQFKFKSSFLSKVKAAVSHSFSAATKDGSAPFGVLGVSGKNAILELANRASDRSRLIVVQSAQEADEYRKSLSDQSNVDVLEYHRIGGLEYDEVYIDLDPNGISPIWGGAFTALDFNKAIFTAVSRATKFVAITNDLAESTVTPQIAAAMDSAAEDFAANTKMFENILGLMENTYDVLTGSKVSKKAAKKQPAAKAPEQELIEQDPEEDLARDSEDIDTVEETTEPVQKSPSVPKVTTSSVEFSLAYPTNENLTDIAPETELRIIAVRRDDKIEYAVAAQKGSRWVVIGVLSDTDFSDSTVGPALKALIAKYENSTARPGIAAALARYDKPEGFTWTDEHDKHLVGQGTVKNIQPLKYKYSTQSKSTIQETIEMLLLKFARTASGNTFTIDKFMTAGKLDMKKVSKFVQAGIFSHRAKDIRDTWNKSRFYSRKFDPKVGAPYLRLNIPGHEPQFVRLQRNLAEPTEEFNAFISAVENLETILGIPFGSEEFSKAIRLAKDMAFEVDPFGDYEMRKRVDFELKEFWKALAGIVPSITDAKGKVKEQTFNNLETLVRGIFGVSTVRVTFDSKKEAQEFINSQPAGKFIIDNNYKSDKVAISEVTDDQGGTRKYKTKSIVAGLGTVQRYLNGLALSNISLDDLHIRVQKRQGNRRYWTGKSLLASDDSKKNFYGELRTRYNSSSIEAKEYLESIGIDASGLPEKLPSIEDFGENQLMLALNYMHEITAGKYGVSTAEFMDMLNKYTSQPITLDTLHKVRKGLKKGQFRNPIHRLYFNELGQDLSSQDNLDALNESVYSELEDIQTTAVRVSINLPKITIAPEQKRPAKKAKELPKAVKKVLEVKTFEDVLSLIQELSSNQHISTIQSLMAIPAFKAQLDNLKIEHRPKHDKSTIRALTETESVGEKVNHTIVIYDEAMKSLALAHSKIEGETFNEAIAQILAHEIVHVFSTWILFADQAAAPAWVTPELKEKITNFLNTLDGLRTTIEKHKEANPEVWNQVKQSAIWPEAWKEYPLKNNMEFITGVFTNPAFIEILKQIPEPTGGSILSKLASILVDLIKALTGRTTTNMAVKAMETILDFYQPIESFPGVAEIIARQAPEQILSKSKLYDKILQTGNEDQKEMALWIMEDEEASEEQKQLLLEGIYEEIRQNLGLFYETDVAGRHKGDLITLEQAKAFVQKIIPGIDVSENSASIQFLSRLLLKVFDREGSEVWARTKAGAMTIGTVQMGGRSMVYDRVLRHELLHYVYTYLTKPVQKKRIRQQAATKYGQYLLYVSEYDFNEFLARQWQDWEPKGLEQQRGIANKVLRFLRDVAKMLGLIRRYHTTIDEFFADIHKGYYSNKYFSIPESEIPKNYAFITDVFGDVLLYRQAKQYIVEKFREYTDKGKAVNGATYPMTKEEIYFAVQQDISKAKLLAAYKAQKLASVIHTLNQQASEQLPLDQKLKIKRELQNYKKQFTQANTQEKYLSALLTTDAVTGNSVYYNMVKIMYPNWRIPSEQTFEELADESLILAIEELEKEQMESTSALREHIVDSETLNMAKKMSDIIKDFTTFIFYPTTDGKYLSSGFAYVKLLQILERIDLTNITFAEFEKQVSKLGKYMNKSKPTEAVLEALYKVVSKATTSLGPATNHMAVVLTQEAKEARPTYYFAYDPLKIADLSKATTLQDIQALKKINPSINIVIGKTYLLSDLIDSINEKSLVVEPELFKELYERTEARNLLAELHTLFSSQKETQLHIAQMSNEYGDKKINYIRAKDLGVHTAIKREIGMSLTRINDFMKASKRDINGFFNTPKMRDIRKKLLSENQIEEGIKDFFSYIGLGHYVSKLVITQEAAAGVLIDKFIQDIIDKVGTTWQDDLIIEEVVQLDANGNPIQVSKTMTLDMVLNDQNGRLNELSSLLTNASELTRATAVKDSENKTIYKYNNSHYAFDLIKKFTLGKVSDVFKGASGHMDVAFSKFLTSDFFKHNIFVQGVNSILSKIEYHDAFRDDDRNFTKPFNQEGPKERLIREFVAGFADVANNTGNRYNQFFYPPSHRSKVFSVEVGLLTMDQVKQGIKAALEQLLEDTAYFENYKNFNAQEHINFRVLDEVLEGKKFDRTLDLDKLTDAIYDKLSEYALEVAQALKDNLVDLPSDILEYQYKLATKTEGKYIDSTAIMAAKAKAEGLKEIPQWALKQNKIKDKKWENGNQLYTAPVDDFLPLIDAYVKNSYINGYFLNQLITGDNRFYKGEEDVVKRIAGPTAPGQRGLVHADFGLNPTFTVAIVNDEKIGETQIDELLSTFLDPEQLESLKQFFAASYETTDAQGFMLPSRGANLRKGFGRSYNMGNVHKPVHFENRITYAPIQKFDTAEQASAFAEGKDLHRVNPIDSTLVEKLVSVPFYAKYSSIELSDDLVDAFPGLKILRERMEAEGIDELLMASAIKVGAPKDNINIASFMGGAMLPNLSKVELSNEHFRLQLNPVTTPDSNVAIYSQLMYFLNVLHKNTGQAAQVYEAVSALIERGIDKLDKKFAKGIRAGLKQALETPSSERASYLYNSGISHNNPVIEQKAVAAIASGFEKLTTKIKFPGGKLVLQSAYGITKYNKSSLSADDIRKGQRLKYIKENDRFFAEVILPRELLTAEQIRAVDKGESVYIYGDMFGFRIPSTELHSAIPMKIVGTYDSKGTNVIIAPKEIVALHGSDYDVDSLFIVRPAVAKRDMLIYDFEAINELGDLEVLTIEDIKNLQSTLILEGTPLGYAKNKDGKWQYDSKQLDQLEAIIEQAREFVEEAKIRNKALVGTLQGNLRNLEGIKDQIIKNLITDTMQEVMTASRNFDRMLNPISMRKFSEVIDKLALGGKVKLDLNRFKTRSEAFDLVQYGQRLTGIFANNIKSLAYMLKAGIPEESTQLKEDIFGIETKLKELKARENMLTAELKPLLSKLQKLSEKGASAKKLQGLNDIINAKDSELTAVKESIVTYNKSKGKLEKKLKNNTFIDKGSRDTAKIHPKMQFAYDYGEETGAVVHNRITEIDIDGNNMWQTQDAAVNAAIDNIKELLLPRMGINTATGNVFSALIGLGMNLESVVTILNQPVIKALNPLQGNQVKKIEELKEQISKSYAAKASTPLNVDDKIASHEELLKALHSNKTLQNMTAEELEQQYMALDIYNKGRQLGENLRTMSSFLRVIREMPSSIEEMERTLNYFTEIFKGSKEFIRDLILSKANKGTFKDMVKQNAVESSMLETTGNFYYDISNFFVVNPHIKSAMKAFLKLHSLIKTSFDVHSKVFSDMLEQVPGLAHSVLDLSKNEIESYAARDSVLKRRELVKYLMSGIYADELSEEAEVGVRMASGKTRILAGTQAFSHRFAQKVWALKELDSKLTQEHPDKYTPNQFLASLSVQRNPITNMEYIRFTKGTSVTEDEYIELEEHFNRLRLLTVEADAEGVYTGRMLNPEEVQLTDFSTLQREFVKYSIFNFGFSFAGSNYASVLPPAIYKDIDNRMNEATKKFIMDEKFRDRIKEHFAISLLVANADKLSWVPPEVAELVEATKEQYIEQDGVIIPVPDYSGSIEIDTDDGPMTIHYDRLYKVVKGGAFLQPFIRLGKGKKAETLVRVHEPFEKNGNVYVAYQRSGKVSEIIYSPFTPATPYKIKDYFSATEKSVKVSNTLESVHVVPTDLSEFIGKSIWIYNFNDATRQSRVKVTVVSVEQIASKQYKVVTTMAKPPKVARNAADFLAEVTNTTNGLNCK